MSFLTEKIDSRYYQEIAVETAKQDLTLDAGSLIKSPTGTGKTVMAAQVIDWWLSKNKNNRVLALNYQQELVTQFAEEMERFLSCPVGVEMARQRADQEKHLITSASRQTLAHSQGRRLEQFDADRYNWLIVCDEAHRYADTLQTFAPIREKFQSVSGARYLGITATPYRRDGENLRGIFPRIALDYALYSQHGPSAISDGYLTPFNQKFVQVHDVTIRNMRAITEQIERRGPGGSRRRGRIQNLDDLRAAVETKEELARMLDPVIELMGDRKCILYCPYREYSRLAAEYINQKRKGELAQHLDGSFNKKQREEILDRHQRGSLQYLLVCQLCREGYNDETIQGVALLTQVSTVSPHIPIQCKGRGARTWPGVIHGLKTAEERKAAIAASPKPECLVVDMVGATDSESMLSALRMYRDASEAALLRAGEILQEGQQEDIQAALDLAEQEEEERLAEEARQAEELERIRQAEELEAKVRYTVETRRLSEEGKISFGRFRGREWREAPAPYLQWIIENHSRPWMVLCAREALKKKGEQV